MQNESILPSAVSDEEMGFDYKTQGQLALDDIAEGATLWRTWLLLAYQDIRLRYRRSTLGPFWITLSMAITVYSMGFLYSQLFHTDLQHYLPFLVSGMISWSLISMIITDTTETFATARGMLRQIKLPYTLYVHRVAARNIIIFLHNILVIIPILFLFHQFAQINLYTLLLFPGLFFIYLNAISFGLILGLLGSRFRDVPPIIKSLIGVLFFVTPVMWDPKILSAKVQHFVLFNPLYAFIQIIRAPMIGQKASLSCYVLVLIITLLGLAVSFSIFKKYRARIVYWV